jgi:hypothetical protein
MSRSLNSLIKEKHLWLPLIISLIFLVTISILARSHTFGTYETETDFYHYYGPDAKRIAARQFPENTFQGPGYSLMLALVNNFVGDLFVTGKWISIISGALIGLLVFILFYKLFSYWVGISAQIIVLVSPLFSRFAINATTDIFFLLLCLASLVIFTADKIPLKWRIPLSAILTSAVYLTRYNGIFLVISFLSGILLLNIFDLKLFDRLKFTTVFIGIFFISVSPWLYANHKHHGSAFYNTNYLNIATEFYPELADSKVNQDATRVLNERFHSFLDVFKYDADRVLKLYPVKLYENLKKSVTNGELVSPFVGWFALLGLILSLYERKSKTVVLLIGTYVFYMLLLSLTHWETRYYFFAMIVYAGLAAYAAFRLFEILRTRSLLTHPSFKLIPILLIAMMCITSFAASKKEMTRFLANHPEEVIKASEYFHQSNIKGARVMARKPHIAYIGGQEWIFFPQFKSIDELKSWLSGNHVDYVVISSVEIKRRPALAFLKDPNAAPSWLNAVWNSTDVVIYQPQYPIPNK